MAQGTSTAQSPGAPGALPAVRVELRHGSARPATYDLNDVSFLIGTVPGCDLRLPGAHLPSVICLISRHTRGVTIRKLAPILPIQVNGQAVTTANLSDGDRVTIGPVELRLYVEMPIRMPAGEAQDPAPVLTPEVADEHRQKELDQRQAELEISAADLTRRQQQLEQQARELAALHADLRQRELALQTKVQSTRSVDPVPEEQAALHRELAELRQQLLQDYQRQGERLAAHRAALRVAGRKLRDRKRQLDTEASEHAGRLRQVEELTAERSQFQERCGQLESRLLEMEHECARRQADLDQRERQLASDRTALEQSQEQHRQDLVRLDRLQGTLDQREQELKRQSEELARGAEQLRQEAAELEEQASQMDEWHARLTADAEELEKKKKDQETAASHLQQRSAALEGQQAMLAALRTRLERMREELRREEKQLTEQRNEQAALEARLQQQLKEAEDLRAQLENERQLREREVIQHKERQAIMEAAVTRLREAQDAAGRQEELLRQREAELQARVNELEEEAAILNARGDQLAALQQRLAAEREALQQREAAVGKAEQAVTALQEQLRRRSEELAARQKAQIDQTHQYEETLKELDGRRAELDRERQQADARAAEIRRELEARQGELDQRTTELEQAREELARREQTLLHSIERLKEAGRAVGRGRKELADERARAEAERQQTFASLTQAHRDFEAARDEVIDLQRQLPELELQAKEAAEKLAQAREQLRGHLAEIHGYTRQSREDLEMLQAQVRSEAERVREQEIRLHRERDEHRLAVAAFRQQLIDWQGHVEDLKRSLARGETRLERRQAQVDAQVRAVDETSQRLARQAQELEEQERAVAERRTEVEQHLEDMRLWYRRKLRELAGIRDETEEQPASSQEESGERDILSLTGDVDPPDRQLGDLLQSLGLVDADTLNALWIEARRQRRTLRQLLLAGNYLTLYQVALMEAGNLDGLALGPLRVIDRLRATPVETVYRVFDPRRNQEALLRHLGEEEMQDAVRPDEFRQRFAAAAAVQHPNLAATWEVLEIADRPAALQEWLRGLPSNDWPTLAGAPGVWYRLVTQAFSGLSAAHQAGLVHGHLQASSVLLAPDGVLKLCGFGEPAWLPGAEGSQESDAAADIAALGRIVAEWSTAPSLGKKSRPKPLPDALQAVLERFTAADPTTQYATAAEVLEDLEKAGAEVPANAAAWDRFVRLVRDQAADAAIRLSA